MATRLHKLRPGRSRAAHVMITFSTLCAGRRGRRMCPVKLCELRVKDPLGTRRSPISGGGMASEMRNGFGYRAMPAPYALPAAFAMFLALGTVAAALHGRLSAPGVLIICTAITLIMSFAAEPVAA